MHVNMLGLTAFAANYSGTQIDTRSAIDAISAMYCLLDGSIMVTAPGDACLSQATAGIGVCACSSSARRSRSVPRPPHEGLTIPQSKHRHLRLTHFSRLWFFCSLHFRTFSALDPLPTSLRILNTSPCLIRPRPTPAVYPPHSTTVNQAPHTEQAQLAAASSTRRLPTEPRDTSPAPLYSEWWPSQRIGSGARPSAVDYSTSTHPRTTACAPRCKEAQPL
jgi:hypothetical protein